MKAAHEKGTPVIRPLFYDFPEQERCWTVEDQYMFGPDLLVAPALYEGMRSRKVYLPGGAEWTDARNGKVYQGDVTVEVAAPLESIPVFLKNGARIPVQG